MTKYRVPFLLAIRNIKLNRKDRGRGLVGAVLAVGLSLIPLVVVLEVANGMIEGITRRFIEIGTYHLQLSLYDDMDLSRHEQLALSFQKVRGVITAFPERQGLGLVKSRNALSGVQIRGIPPELYREDEAFRRFLKIDSGSFNLFQPSSLLLGKAIAARLDVKVGDEVKLLTSKVVRGKKPIYRISSFKVAGIFSTGYQDLDKSWIYIPIEVADRIMPDARQIVGVKVAEPFEDMNGIIKDISSIVSRKIPIFRINTWYEMEENQYGSFRTTKALLVLIMALIVIVASVNVSSAMVMIVLEKTREIGILKSMGAGPFTITLSFILTGFFTGTLGALLGITIGLVLAVNINEVIRGIGFLLDRVILAGRWLIEPFVNLDDFAPINIMDPAFYLETIPITINLLEVMSVAFLAVFLSTLASLLPARRAGSIKPMEVLRKV